MKRVIFVAVETNAAAFVVPLLSHWQRAGAEIDWRLIVGPYAEECVRKLAPGLARLVTENTAAGFAAAYGRLAQAGWMPDAFVVSAAGHPLEFAAMEAAAGHPRAQFIDTWTNYRRRFEGPEGLVVGERIFVIDANAVREAAEAGLPVDRFAVVGQPSWEFVTPMPPARRDSVLYLSAPVSDGYGRTLGYTEDESWRLVTNLRARRPDLFAELLYSAHPVQKRPEPALLAGAILMPFERGLLDRVGTVLGMFSSPMIDAFLAGRAVVSVQPGAIGPDQCPLSRHGFIDRVDSEAALATAMEHPRSSGRDDLAAALHGSVDRLARAVLELAA